jgi:MFS family permease
MGNQLLVAMAAAVGIWQMCHHAAVVVQILFATRELGLSAGSVGLCYIALGVGTISAGLTGHRISRRLGTGPSMLLGFGICGFGWSLCSLTPSGTAGVVGFTLMLYAFGVGATLVFINFLALRQAVTPAPLLGRMTSTMRWLILLPAGPGALLGGWLGEHLGLRTALGFAGVTALTLMLVAGRSRILRDTRTLPTPVSASPAEPTRWPDRQAGEYVP